MGVRLHVRSCWASSKAATEAVYELDQGRIVIGRGRGADVRLPHRAVSIRHATIELDGARYVLVDHDTTNGTKVEGARIVPGRNKPLRDGDRIEIGGFAIVFKSGLAVTTPTSGERTASLARRLAREALDEPGASLSPSLTILNGPREGASIVLPAPPARLVLGRGDDVDVALPDEDASREHAELEIDLDGALLRDLGSKNGVLVGGRRVTERRLADRDELRVGATVILYEDPASPRLDGLDEGEDEAVEVPMWAPAEPSAPEAEPAPADDDPALPELEPPPPPAPRARGVSLADMVIYVLASAVFALSILGLVWLLRG